MSGLTISTIREALATTVRNGIDRETTVLPYPTGKTVPGPAILVDAANDFVDYWVTMSGLGVSTLRFVLQIDPVKGTDIESAWRRLDDYLSAGDGNASSLIDALVTTKDLGLTSDRVAVQVGAVTVSADEQGMPFASLDVTVSIHKKGAAA